MAKDKPTIDKETINSLIGDPQETDKISSLWDEEKPSKPISKSKPKKAVKKETINSLWIEEKPQKPKKAKKTLKKKSEIIENTIEPHKPIQPHILTKHDANPILNPNKDNWWESEQVFNPGVIEIDGVVHMVYRSIGGDGVSRFGYAKSEDGFTVSHRLSYPVYKHELVHQHNFYFDNPSGGSWGGGEDPRLVRVENEDTVYMTYTACDNGLRIGLTSIKADDLSKGRWKWTKPILISKPGQVQKNWVLFPEKIKGKYAILHRITPKVSIEYRDSMNFKRNEFIESKYENDETREGVWDSWVRGAGPPPLKTKEGWLVFYHAMDKYNPRQYLLGAMLLDLENPEKILHRSTAPILIPEEVYENEGFKSGVVYASGAIIRDGNIIVYYGGADSYVCAAYTNLDAFLANLMNDKVLPELKSETQKKVKKTNK